MSETFNSLCRYFFKSPKPKQAETSISYLISSELKEQSYQPHYIQHVIFVSKTHFFQQFPPSARKEFVFGKNTLPKSLHLPWRDIQSKLIWIIFFIIYLCTNTTYVQIQFTYISKILYTGALCIYYLFMFTNLNISYKRIKVISVFANWCVFRSYSKAT